MTFQIEYDGHEARIQPRLTGPVGDGMREVMSYSPTGSEFSPTHVSQMWKGGTFNRKAHWDGKISLFKKNLKNIPYNSFPSGMIPQAETFLKRINQSVTTTRLIPMTPPDLTRSLNGRQAILKGIPVTVEVRDYQYDVIAELLACPQGRAMAESPTGSGKSIMLAELCYIFNTLTVLVTVPTLSLLHQTSEDLANLLGETVGKIGDQIYSVGRVTVATIDSLRTGLKKLTVKDYLKTVQVWLIDESHLSAADSYKSVSEQLVNTEYRFGLSATVRREDGHELVFHGIIGPLVKKLTPMELIEAGWLARPRIEMHVVEHEYTHEGTKKPSYSDVYQACIVQNMARNNYILEQCYRAQNEKQDPVLILIQDLEHGDILQDMIAQLGPCAYLKGEDDQKDRKKVVARFQKGEIPFLVASTIFDIGIDIPEIRTIIMAGAGKSPARAIQRVGRGLRKTGNKTECLIIDFEDRLGYHLLDHSTQRYWWYGQYYPGCCTRWNGNKVILEMFS